MNFLPGSVKYGDLPAMLALAAPHALWLGGEGPQAPALIAAAYRAAGAPSSSVSIYNGADEGKMAAAVKWLLTP